LICAIAAALLVGYWPWNIGLVICACALWRLNRSHEIGRVKLDPISSSGVRQISGRDFEPDPRCWSVARRERIIDARPSSNGGSGSWTCEETSNAVYAGDTSNGGQGFHIRAMRQARQDSATGRVECIMSGRPGCICEFPTVDEFLTHISDVIEERQNIT
jgi:hypothetical protein